MSSHVYITAEVEIDLYEIDEETLLEHIEERGISPFSDSQQLAALYEAKRYHPEKFDEMFSNVVYNVLGKVC